MPEYLGVYVTRRMALVLPAIFGVLFLIIFVLIGLAS
jgi:ABC-type microcin C transport system permease subunit YejB